MKKIALKGLLILVISVALCMFFSNTIQTITTPKVQRVPATTGKLEQDISLQAEVYFATTENIYLRDAQEMNLTVDTVYVRPGSYVEAGDMLFTALLPGYAEEKEKLMEEYEKAAASLAEETAANVKLAASSEQNDLYNAIVAAGEDLYARKYEAYEAAQKEGYTLPGEIAQWGALADASDAVRDTAQAALNASAAYDAAITALSRYFKAGNRIKDVTFEYIKKADGYRQQILDYQTQMLELDALRAGLAVVYAPHSGYIVSFGLKSGDTYDGKKAAYVLSGEGAEPLLRADITDVRKEIANDTKAEVKGTYSTQKTTVVDTMLGSDGKKYICLTLSEDIKTLMGGLPKMMSAATPVTVSYKAAQATTLLPAASVHSDSGDTYYVYIIEQNYGGLLNNSTLAVRKQTVTVIDKSDTLVSVLEDLSYRDIAYREDRALSDGAKVMEYMD